MEKKFIIKKNKDIAKLAKKSQKIFTDCFTVYFEKSDELRFCVSISKKCGNAVVRNHEKRCVREIVRKFFLGLKVSILIVVRENAIKLEYNEKEKKLKSILNKIMVKTNEE